MRCLALGFQCVVELLGAYEVIMSTVMKLKVSKIWVEGDFAIVVKWIEEVQVRACE